MKTDRELLEQALQVIKTYMTKSEHKRTKLDDGNAKETCALISERLARPETSVRNAWKDAVIDELVCIGICNAEHEINPKKALNDIIKWNCETALDPAVSTEAVNLINNAIERFTSNPVAWLYNGKLYEVDPSAWATGEVIPLFMKRKD